MDERIGDLRNIYKKLDDNRQEKMEQIALRLFAVQTIIDEEKYLVKKELSDLSYTNSTFRNESDNTSLSSPKGV